MGCFVNLTNHLSERWSEEQLQAAGGNVIDVPFPNVDPDATSDHVKNLADGLVSKVLEHEPDTVLVQGEMTLTYRVVNLLRQKGVRVVAATSKREVVETTREDGSTDKRVVFRFVRFREYV